MFKKSLTKVISLMVSMSLALVIVATIPTVNASALTMTYTPSSGYKNSIYYQQLTEVELTGDQVTDIINVAKSQLGYHEGDSTADYGGGNLSGSGNYTEYGRWIGVENVKWCATFVAWCAEQAGISTDIIAKQSWASGLDATSTVGHFGNAFRLFGTYTPKVGDLVYYNTHGNGEIVTSHVEIVSEVGDDYFVSIGGNSGNKVKTHKIPLDTGVLDSDFVTIGFESPNYINTSVVPTNVDLTISNDWFNVDDYIVFNIDSTNATSLRITVTKDGETVLNAPIYGTCMTTIKSLLNLGDTVDDSVYGEYEIWLTATNVTGSTDSKVSTFAVVDTPTYKNVTCKSGFTLEDDVSITVNDSYANGRNIYIEDADGNTVVSSECDSTYTIPASELGVGEYTVYFELYNNMGTTLTDRYSFGIYEYAPSYIDVTIDKTTYTVGETVTLNFNSEYATDYKVTILRDNGKVYHMSSTENTTYTTTLPLGNYSISVTAYNPAGSVTSSAIDVNVVSKTIGDVNGDNVLNYLDALTFKKYLLNIEDTTQNADLNGDGIVNIVDYIELMSLLEAKE